jgi:hypothetical protein
MVWFAATGFCIMANGLYWLGAEPRLTPESLPSARCTECPKSGSVLVEIQSWQKEKALVLLSDPHRHLFRSCSFG